MGNSNERYCGPIKEEQLEKLNVTKNDWLEQRLRILFQTECDYIDFVNNYWSDNQGSLLTCIHKYRVDKLQREDLS